MPFVLLGAVLISLAPVLVRASALPPDLIAFYRMVFGMFWLLGLMAWRPAPKSIPTATKAPAQPFWRVFFQPVALLAGIAFAIDLFCWHRCIYILGPGLATLLANLQVLLVAAYGVLSKQELPRKGFWFAAPLALLGLGLIVSASTLPRAQVVPGLLLGLGAALAYSTYLVLLRQIERQPGVDSRQTIFQVSLAAALLAAGVSILEGKALLIPDRQALFYLLAYGFLIQGLAWMLIARGMKEIPAWQASMTLLLQPVLALGWDMLFFQRHLNRIEDLGLMLTLGAIVLVLQPGWRLPRLSVLKSSIK